MPDAKTIDVSTISTLVSGLRQGMSVHSFPEIGDVLETVAADRDRLAAENAMFLEQLVRARGENRNADLQVIMAANNDLFTQLTAALKRAEDAERQWRCFHCDEVFMDREAALEHFGPHCLRDPACQIDIKKFREMEEMHERELAEDSDSHRQFYSMQADHSRALIREGQKGYDKGVADMRAELAAAVTRAEDAERERDALRERHMKLSVLAQTQGVKDANALSAAQATIAKLRKAMDAAHGKLCLIAVTEAWTDSSIDGWHKSPGAVREFAETAAAEVDVALNPPSELMT